jgi:small redox-active disulfide protein 2
MRKVQVLGTGCPKCKQLYENAREASRGAGQQIQVLKVEDIREIMTFGVMMTPALAVDGEVKSTGKVLSVDEIRTLLG